MNSRILILFTLLIITNCDEIFDIFPPEIDLISPKDRVLIENSAKFIVTASAVSYTHLTLPTILLV